MTITNIHTCICFPKVNFSSLRGFMKNVIVIVSEPMLILGLIALSLSLSAQGANNSPFSRFGIGDLRSEDGMNTRLMGGLGVAHLDIYHLNFVNPASFSFLKAAAFDIALEAKSATIRDKRNESNQWSGNMSYLAMGFPLRNPLNQIFTNEDYKFNLGMGFALLPNSDVSYNITRFDSLPNVGALERNFSGSGGTYKALWSNSIKYGNASLGLSLGYVFGKVNFERNIDFLEEVNAYDNQFLTDYSLSGLYAKLGFLYMHVLNKAELEDNIGREAPKYLSFGATYKPKTGFSAVSDISNININPSAGIRDTAINVLGVVGSGNFPSELGLGMSYGGGTKLTLGLDYRLTRWSQYRNEANPENLADTYRVAFGGSYRPNANDISHFFNRIFYKFGIHYEQDPRSIESQNLDGYGISLGLGLPFAWQRKFSNMNLGVTFGKRSVANILSENFTTISFGFTFNDSEWFIKRKFN